MRNRYVLAGVGVAALVAAAIVVAGSLADGDTGKSVAVAPSPAQSLPPGHPDVKSADGSTEPAAAGSSSVDRSIRELEKQHNADPADVAVLLKLGDEYFLAQRYGQAEKSFREALNEKPGDPTATVRLAMVWHANGDTERALQAIKSVLKQKPQNQEAHYSLAIVYFSKERVQDARDEWAKAAAIDPASTIGRPSRTFVDLIDGKDSSGSSGED